MGGKEQVNGTIAVFNGPNLNLLGEREPEIYGSDTLADVQALCEQVVKGTSFSIDFRQTNNEAEMVDWIQSIRKGYAGFVINPAAFTYAAYPILDAIKLLDCPVVEVHISNIHRREAEWRSQSIMTQVVTGIISGLGIHGYPLAVQHVMWLRGRGA